MLPQMPRRRWSGHIVPLALLALLAAVAVDRIEAQGDCENESSFTDSRSELCSAWGADVQDGRGEQSCSEAGAAWEYSPEDVQAVITACPMACERGCGWLGNGGCWDADYPFSRCCDTSGGSNVSCQRLAQIVGQLLAAA